MLTVTFIAIWVAFAFVMAARLSKTDLDIMHEENARLWQSVKSLEREREEWRRKCFEATLRTVWAEESPCLTNYERN